MVFCFFNFLHINLFITIVIKTRIMIFQIQLVLISLIANQGIFNEHRRNDQHFEATGSYSIITYDFCSITRDVANYERAKMVAFLSNEFLKRNYNIDSIPDIKLSFHHLIFGNLETCYKPKSFFAVGYDSLINANTEKVKGIIIYQSTNEFSTELTLKAIMYSLENMDFIKRKQISTLSYNDLTQDSEMLKCIGSDIVNSQIKKQPTIQSVVEILNINLEESFDIDIIGHRYYIFSNDKYHFYRLPTDTSDIHRVFLELNSVYQIMPVLNRKGLIIFDTDTSFYFYHPPQKLVQYFIQESAILLPFHTTFSIIEENTESNYILLSYIYGSLQEEMRFLLLLKEQRLLEDQNEIEQTLKKLANENKAIMMNSNRNNNSSYTVNNKIIIVSIICLVLITIIVYCYIKGRK